MDKPRRGQGEMGWQRKPEGSQAMSNCSSLLSSSNISSQSLQGKSDLPSIKRSPLYEEGLAVKFTNEIQEFVLDLKTHKKPRLSSHHLCETGTGPQRISEERETARTCQPGKGWESAAKGRAAAVSLHRVTLDRVALTTLDNRSFLCKRKTASCRCWVMHL